MPVISSAVSPSNLNCGQTGSHFDSKVTNLSCTPSIIPSNGKIKRSVSSPNLASSYKATSIKPNETLIRSDSQLVSASTGTSNSSDSSIVRECVSNTIPTNLQCLVTEKEIKYAKPVESKTDDNSSSRGSNRVSYRAKAIIHVSVTAAIAIASIAAAPATLGLSLLALPFAAFFAVGFSAFYGGSKFNVAKPTNQNKNIEEESSHHSSPLVAPASKRLVDTTPVDDLEDDPIYSEPDKPIISKESKNNAHSVAEVNDGPIEPIYSQVVKSKDDKKDDKVTPEQAHANLSSFKKTWPAVKQAPRVILSAGSNFAVVDGRANATRVGEGAYRRDADHVESSLTRLMPANNTKTPDDPITIGSGSIGSGVVNGGNDISDEKKIWPAVKQAPRVILSAGSNFAVADGRANTTRVGEGAYRRDGTRVTCQARADNINLLCDDYKINSIPLTVWKGSSVNPINVSACVGGGS